jgi:hypothetical protein
LLQALPVWVLGLLVAVMLASRLGSYLAPMAAAFAPAVCHVCHGCAVGGPHEVCDCESCVEAAALLGDEHPWVKGPPHGAPGSHDASLDAPFLVPPGPPLVGAAGCVGVVSIEGQRVPPVWPLTPPVPPPRSMRVS